MRTFFIWTLLFSFAPCAALSAPPQKSLNLARLKSDTRIFESVVKEVLKQHFSNPLAITAEPRATFLKGYGVVVTFQASLSRARIRTPFGEMPVGRNVKSQQQQVKTIKEAMIQCLADYGASIKQLGPQDRISISGSLEDGGELDPAKSRTTLILTVTREDVDLYAMRKINLSHFQQRVTVTEY